MNAIRFATLAVALLLTVSAGGTAAAAAGRGLPPGALRAQRVQIMDRNGFGEPLPAIFALIPLGWRTQGGVQWGNQFMCVNGYNFDWVAQSPDGLQTVAIMPQQKWESNNYGAGASNPGCGSAQIRSVQQYLQATVSRMGNGARVLDFRPRPDLAAQFANLNRVTPAAMGEFRVWVESGEALFAFNDKGREMRGVATVTAAFSLSRMSGVTQGQTMDALTGTAFPGFVATAPNGQLNLKFTEAIRQSLLPNPAWQAAIADHNTRIARGAAQEIAKRAKIISEYNDYVSLLRKETADMRARSDEKRQREFGELMRGNETYNDGNAPGGQVELSNMYDHAWRLNDGSYVLSNDASFEPFRDLGLAGSRLERTQ
ncbi:MAG: hypothetical protein ABI859_07140 [Pseudomonadota bacterium]